MSGYGVCKAMLCGTPRKRVSALPFSAAFGNQGGMKISSFLNSALALVLTFLLAPVPTRSQEAATSPSVSTAESVKYPNTKAGLQQFLSDIREAARANESGKLSALVKGTEIPDCDAWLHAMYESDKADSWMGLCDAKTLRSTEKSLEAQFTDLAKADGEFVMRKVNDDPEPGRGMEWGWLQAIRQPLDIYFARWKSAETATSEPIGYFMFISGGFRWESGVTVSKIVPEQDNAQTATAADQFIKGTTYFNRTAHFTLTVPPDWHVTDSLIKNTPNVIGTVGTPRGGAFIMIQRYNYPLSPEMAAQIVESGYSKRFPGYQKIRDERLTIDGKGAASFVFRFDGVPGTQAQLPGKMLVVFILNGDSVLGLMCEAPDPLFDQMENTYKKIVTSYHYSPAR
jgi:hypothetical protein